MKDLFAEQILKIQQQYKTAGPFYLSEFYESSGDQKLHNFLKSAYRPEYQDNFRIVIVQDCVDIYDYDDLPGRGINALQKHLAQIDISNFFVLVVTNNKNIQHELAQVKNLYSTDDCEIQSHIVADSDYKIQYFKQDTFCALPWTHLYVGTDGNVLPCCLSDHDFAMGNIQEQSVDSIIKSTSFNRLRSNMLNGQRSKECSRCYAQEDAGISSARMDHNRRWPKITKNTVDSSGTIQNFKPRYLDIRLNNICNLKCRMCSGYFSSAIAQEDVELFGNRKFVASGLDAKQRSQNIDEILDYLPDVEKIYFAGGEPLLTAEHYVILDALIACGNTNLEITYNTNFTTLSYRNRNVLDLWHKFSNITVGASLDAHGAVAEYVRHGTNWQKIEKNLELVKSTCPHVRLTVTSTVGLLNATSLMELQKNWHTEKKLDISKFSQTIMISPPHLTVAALSLDHKNWLDQLIKSHMVWCESVDARSLAKQWHDVLTYMWAQDDSHHLPEFKRLTQIMDNHRNESLVRVLPEIKNLV